ncbi:hypothetical protein ACEQPO_10630 [Bacillus sp. SL00103]
MSCKKTDLTDRYLNEFVEDENLPALRHLLTSLKETGKAKGELPVTLQSGQYRIIRAHHYIKCDERFLYVHHAGYYRKKVNGRKAVKK